MGSHYSRPDRIPGWVFRGTHQGLQGKFKHFQTTKFTWVHYIELLLLSCTMHLNMDSHVFYRISAERQPKMTRLSKSWGSVSSTQVKKMKVHWTPMCQLLSKGQRYFTTVEVLQKPVSCWWGSFMPWTWVTHQKWSTHLKCFKRFF